MPEVRYYNCDGPGCERADYTTAPGQSGSFTEIEVKVSRLIGLQIRKYKFCGLACLVAFVGRLTF